MDQLFSDMEQKFSLAVNKTLGNEYQDRKHCPGFDPNTVCVVTKTTDVYIAKSLVVLEIELNQIAFVEQVTQDIHIENKVGGHC